MKRSDAAAFAREKFSSGYTCAQSVVAAYNEASGAGIPLAPFAAMGKGLFSGCVCGALAGAEACIGHATAKAQGEVTPKTRKMAAALHDKFKKRFGATCCRVLSRGMAPGSDEQTRHCSEIISFCAEGVAALAKKR